MTEIRAEQQTPNVVNWGNRTTLLTGQKKKMSYITCIPMRLARFMNLRKGDKLNFCTLQDGTVIIRKVEEGEKA